MQVYNEVGYGLSEPIYQECLSIVCDEMDIPFEREKTLEMVFHQQVLQKKYIADFICYGDIIVELKAVENLTNDHRAQLFNYMRITSISCGVLINFGNPNRIITERYIFDSLTNRFRFIK